MSLTKSSVLVSVISLFISLVSLANQILIAKYFGAGRYMDIFLFASSLPLMVGGIIASAFSFSLVPHLIKMMDSLGIEYKMYFTLFIKKSLVIIFLISTISASIFIFIIPYVYLDLNPEELKIARFIAVISWLGLIPSIIFTILSCSFNARKSFYFPLLLNLFPYFTTIAFTLAFYKSIGIVSLSLGVLIGSIASVFLGLGRMKQDLVLTSINNHLFKARINDYLKYLRFAIIAMLTFTVFQSIDSFWATKLGPSNLSYLGYSQRIIIAFGGLIIAGPSTVLIPRLTKSIQENRESDFLKDSLHLVILILSLASFLAVVCSVYANPIIRILFQRGKFSLIDVENMSKILPFMLSGMVLMLNVVVLFRALFVKEKGSLVALIGIICSVMYFTLSGFLSTLFSVQGIAISYLITWGVIFCLTIYYVFVQDLKLLINKNTLVFIFKQVVIILIIYLVNIFLSNYLSIASLEKTVYELIFLLIVVGFISLIIYLFLVSYVLKIEIVVNFARTVLKMFQKA